MQNFEILVWFERSPHSAQVSRQSCPCPLKLMTSQAVEGTWIRTGGYGLLRGEWVKVTRSHAHNSCPALWWVPWLFLKISILPPQKRSILNIRDLTILQRRRHWKRHWKIDFTSFEFFRPYTKSPSYLKGGKLGWNWREETASDFKERVQFIALPFLFSNQLKMWSFHVVVVQGRQRNVQRKRDARAELLLLKAVVLRWCNLGRLERLFLAQHSVAMVEQCYNLSKQCLDNVVTFCCAKNRRCESSRVTSRLDVSVAVAVEVS